MIVEKFLKENIDKLSDGELAEMFGWNFSEIKFNRWAYGTINKNESP